MIFQKFRTRFLIFSRNLRFFVIQARSALGSEHRRLVRTPRRLIPPNQPMGQLRTQWRCQENSATASSRSKRLWNVEGFCFRILVIFWVRTRQNVVALSWVRLWSFYRNSGIPTFLKVLKGILKDLKGS